MQMKKSYKEMLWSNAVTLRSLKGSRSGIHDLDSNTNMKILLAAKDVGDHTPLHVAAKAGSLKTMEVLLGFSRHNLISAVCCWTKISKERHR
jgi:hypothetical protein